MHRHALRCTLTVHAMRTDGNAMGTGPYGAVHGRPPTQTGYMTSPQWSDNVGRMHQFVKENPDVSITTPRQNGTREFVAVWVEPQPDGEGEGTRVQLSDAHLGFLMDKVEARFRD